MSDGEREMFLRQTPFPCQNFSIHSSETVDHPAFLAEVFSAEIAALLLSFSHLTLIGGRKDTKNFFVHLGKETVVQFFLDEIQFASLCSRGENISSSFPLSCLMGPIRTPLIEGGERNHCKSTGDRQRERGHRAEKWKQNGQVNISARQKIGRRTIEGRVKSLNECRSTSTMNWSRRDPFTQSSNGYRSICSLPRLDDGG